MWHCTIVGIVSVFLHLVPSSLCDASCCTIVGWPLSIYTYKSAVSLFKNGEQPHIWVIFTIIILCSVVCARCHCTVVQVHCCFTSTETVRTIRGVYLNFHTALSSETFRVQCCFTSTENIRTIRYWKPRTVTSTFTQLLSSVVLGSGSVLLYVHRDYIKDC